MALTWKLEDHLRNRDGARSLDHLNLSTMAAVVAGHLPSPSARGRELRTCCSEDDLGGVLYYAWEKVFSLIVAEHGDLKFYASFLKSNFPLHLFHLTYALEVKC